MTIKRAIVGLTIFLVLICCAEKTTAFQFEKEVFYEIAPKIIDSLYLEVREIHPRLIEEFSTEKVGSSKKENAINIVVGILDSVYGLEQTENWRLENHFFKFKISLDTTDNSEKYQMELSKLKPSDIFNFKLLSDIPDSPERWKKSKDFFLAGISDFSRIRFDSERKYGILKTGLHCGHQCGVYYRVYIKKINEEWVIDEIEDYMWE